MRWQGDWLAQFGLVDQLEGGPQRLEGVFSMIIGHPKAM
jgi:hypothetical protein